MKVELDNGYYTGNHATVGGGESWTEVPSLPDEQDRMKARCYRWENDTWVFDKKLYGELEKQRLQEEQEKAERLFEEKKEAMIVQSRKNLADYLASHTVTSMCHGEPAEYSITSEKQTYLASMIMTAQMAAEAGLDYQPSWNASGKVCTYDWTLEQLRQLAFEIEGVVRPLVSGQQTMETLIRAAQSVEELDGISITFGEAEHEDTE